MNLTEALAETKVKDLETFSDLGLGARVYAEHHTFGIMFVFQNEDGINYGAKALSSVEEASAYANAIGATEWLLQDC